MIKRLLQRWAIAYERSRPIEVSVRIPFSETSLQQLTALHRRAGNMFTVRDMEEEITRVVRERLGIDAVTATVVANPNWTGKA